MMALDISSSMLAEDFSPNRLEAAKEVATRFINGRSNDRIGLVLFSGEAFTQCPSHLRSCTFEITFRESGKVASLMMVLH